MHICLLFMCSYVESYACMYFSMKALILSFSLLHIVTCTVYNVIPDDHNTTCNHCQTLQYYQLNITKYFTSNTQLLFLPGLHHLHSDLIIQNVHNISLVGTANGTTLDTVTIIQYAKIVMNNITNLTIKTLMIQRNESLLNSSTDWLSPVVIIRDCINVLVNYLQIHITHDGPIEFTSLLLVNILGRSQVSHILCNNIEIHYTETEIENEDSYLLIDHYQTQNKYLTALYNIILSVKQTSYRVTIQISNTTVAYYINSFFSLECNSDAGAFKLIIAHCQFKFNYNGVFTNQVYDRKGCNAIVYFKNCQLLNNKSYANEISINGIAAHITDCVFNNSMLRVYHSSHINSTAIVNINSTVFTNANVNCSLQDIDYDLISLENTTIIFSGTVVFTNITCRDTIISLKEFSTIIVNGLVQFSKNHVNKLVNFKNNHYQFLIMKEPAALEIMQNKLCTIFSSYISANSLSILFFPIHAIGQ